MIAANECLRHIIVVSRILSQKKEGRAKAYGNPYLAQPLLGTAVGDAMNKERGAMGYMLLWVMGVPGSLLFLIFLMRGCH